MARTCRIFDDDVPAWTRETGFHSYDELLEGEPDRALDEIVADLSRRGSTGDLTYLVPSLPGDVTVDRLDPGLIASVTVTHEMRSGFGLGRCLIVDALEIAVAECQSPFERGYLALDPAIPLIVTNWYGASIVDLAGRRLRALYGTDDVSGCSRGTARLVPAIERLQPAASVSELEHIVARLRRPDGCPWDREQTRESFYPQFVEELDEFGEAIRNGDVPNQMEELGDVLFHVIAQCQLAAESGDFTLDDVLREISGKLIRRHPHVFGDVEVATFDDVLETWNRVKAEEKAAASVSGRDQRLQRNEGDRNL